MLLFYNMRKGQELFIFQSRNEKEKEVQSSNHATITNDLYREVYSEQVSFPL